MDTMLIAGSVIFVVLAAGGILLVVRNKKKRERQQEEAGQRRVGLKQQVADGKVVEPQMGHAITPSVLPDWEKRRQQERAFEEISKLLWQKENVEPDPDSEPM